MGLACCWADASNFADRRRPARQEQVFVLSLRDPSRPDVRRPRGLPDTVPLFLLPDGVPRLHAGIDIRDAVVTMDAMGCQKASAGLIRSRGGDYMLALKGNQGLAHEEMRAFMEDAVANTPERLAFHETLDKGHGRLETRRCWQSAALGWFAHRNLSGGQYLRPLLIPVGGEYVVKKFYASALTHRVHPFSALKASGIAVTCDCVTRRLKVA